MIKGYYMCECGAVTMETDDGNTYSCKRRNLKTFVPGMDLRKLTRLHAPTGSCDHCVNHYGMDLCACGSGLPPEKCDRHTRVCGKPMQKFDVPAKRTPFASFEPPW